MLTYLLALTPVVVAHWLARRMGIYEGLHDWMHGMCPCGN